MFQNLKGYSQTQVCTFRIPYALYFPIRMGGKNTWLNKKGANPHLLSGFVAKHLCKILYASVTSCRLQPHVSPPLTTLGDRALLTAVTQIGFGPCA